MRKTVSLRLEIGRFDRSSRGILDEVGVHFVDLKKKKLVEQD